MSVDVAKVFMSGRSQAVRLPKHCRFATDEVTIERQGDALVLRPRPSEADWWAELEQVLSGFEGVDFVDRTTGSGADDDIASLD